MLTLVGVQGDHPPTTVPGFNQFATSVGPSEIATVLHEGEPVDAPIAFRFPASRRRRYERLPLPTNLVVMGDSLCNFNPVYGQGMSVAALEACALQRHIAAEVVPSSRRVMAALARIVDVPWQMTAAADRAFLPTAGSRDPRERLMARYLDRVQAGAARHATLGRAFLRVAGLVDSPLELLKPGVALRALLPANGK
jgi:2-polyprenyl-6-methoxyphenol hydroxylase-like FAD-dependent oxidoreductase